MSRNIIVRRDLESAVRTRDSAPPSAPAPQADDYNARVMKYIPAEIVAVYVFIQGLLSQSSSAGSYDTLLWIVFGVVLVLTPLYLWRVQHVAKAVQLLISTLAFAVWVFSLGGPFASLSWYQAIYGAVLLPLFTFAVGVIVPTT